MDFITAADVDAHLGMGWEGPDGAERAVLMANAWLAERIRRDVPSPVPVAIVQAGAEIAREAAQGKLYLAAGREVTSQTVSAGGGVSVSKTYAAGSADRSAGESLALALIAPWRRRTGVFMLERI